MRPTLETIDLASASQARQSSPWDSVARRRGLIDHASIIDAIKPNPVALDDEGTRQLEASVLSEPTPMPDTEPPPVMEGSSSTLSSGVRPIRPVEVEQTTHAPIALVDDLRGHGLARARLMVRGTAIVAVIGAILLQIVDASFDLHHVLATAATVAAFGTALWVEVVASLYGNVSHRHHLALGVVALTALLVVLAHGGVTMPAALLALLLAHHYAGGGRQVDALVMTSYAGLGVLAIGLLTGLGLLAPTGPFVTGAAATISWAVGLALFIGCAAWLSWFKSRRLAEVARRGRVRVGRRDALLDEAYADIESLRSAHSGHRTGKRLGRYALHEVVGHTFRSDVYRAVSDAGNHVAIKIFAASLPQARIARVFSRATTASNVCPRAVRVHEMGYLADGGFFIAMEMLGRDLASALRAPAGMTATEGLILIDELATALARAHEAHLFHGNIKPSNILQDRAGRWRLTDFDTPGAALGHGTPAPRYAAPELAQGPPTAVSDVFSLAAIAYRLLVRCPALSDSDPFACGAGRPVRPSSLSPLHPDVDALFALALATDPRVRMDSPLAFTEGLRHALDGALPAWQRQRAAQILAIDPYAEAQSPLRPEAQSATLAS